MKVTKKNILSGIQEILENFLDPQQLAVFITEHRDSFDRARVSDNLLNGKTESTMQVKEYIRIQIDEAIAFSEKHLSPEKHLLLLSSLGKLTIELGEFSISKNIFLKSIKHAGKEKKYENISAYSFLMLGNIYSREARWDRSLEHINKGVNLFQKQKDVRGLALCENLIGVIYLAQGKLDLSSQHFEQGLSYLSNKRDKSIQALMEGNIGILRSIQGNYELAFTYYRRALLNFEETGQLKRIAEARNNLGILHTQMKQYELALTEFDSSLRISLSANYVLSQGHTYLGKAFVYVQQNRLDLARAFAERAFKVSDNLHDMLTMAEIYKIYGIIERKNKRYNIAKNHFFTSLKLNREMENDLNIAETSVELAKLYKDMNMPSEAERCFDDALNYYRNISAMEEISRIEKLKTDEQIVE